MNRPLRIALIGNPNCGKTTLFNRLTGSHQTVGNWPGVTVERKTGNLHTRFTRKGTVPPEMIDLPGVYSLSAASLEEQIALKAIQETSPDILINILDATNPERNLYLTLQVLEKEIPTVIALNMMDEVSKLGGKVDTEQLSRRLGVPVVPISAIRGKGIRGLLKAVEEIGEGRGGARPTRPTGVQSRYTYIEQLVQETFSKEARGQDAVARSLGIDRIITHRILAYPIFFLIMGVVFGLTFYFPGAYLQDLMSKLLFDHLSPWLCHLLITAGAPVGLIGLITDGILGGVGGVLLFLPQIAILFGLLSILEDSGYMARGAYIMDRPMRAIGLTGRAFVPLLMGFGCSVPAVMAARTAGSTREQRLAALLVPFVSCSAKLPVYAFIASAFFPKYAGLVILSLYGLGLLVGALVGVFVGKTVLGPTPASFVLELPPYRLPSLNSTLRHIGVRVGHFLQKAATLIFALSVLLWLLQNFDFRFCYVAEEGISMLEILGRGLAPIFKPLGFGVWQATVALLSGFAAKEAVVSSLCLFAGISGGVAGTGGLAALSGIFPSAASGYAFLVFVLFYTPCAATLTALRRELDSRKLTVIAELLRFALAYGITWVVYNIICVFGGG